VASVDLGRLPDRWEAERGRDNLKGGQATHAKQDGFSATRSGKTKQGVLSYRLK